MTSMPHRLALIRRIAYSRGVRLFGLALWVGIPEIRLPEVTQVEGGRASLRGLPAVAVIAEEVSSDVKRYGLDPQWIENRVRSALLRDSVSLLPRDDAESDDRQPLLVARIQTEKFPGRQTFAWHCSLVLHQRVMAGGAGGPSVLASTWEAAAEIGITSGVLLRSSLGKTLDEQAREFARDWEKRATDD
jgi:hypothetical protein